MPTECSAESFDFGTVEGRLWKRHSMPGWSPPKWSRGQIEARLANGCFGKGCRSRGHVSTRKSRACERHRFAIEDPMHARFVQRVLGK